MYTHTTNRDGFSVDVNIMVYHDVHINTIPKSVYGYTGTGFKPQLLSSTVTVHIYVHLARHFCRCSSPAFTPQGQAPFANDVNDLHDNLEAKQLGRLDRFSCWTSTKLVQCYIKHTINVIVFQSAKCQFGGIGVVYESH